MDLYTPRRNKRLKHVFIGKGMSASHFKYKPMKIIDFEISKSWLHSDKDILIAQIITVTDGKCIQNTLWTESYTLIDTIRGTESDLPHYSKIIQKRDGYFYFTKLNDKEKSYLLNV